MDCYTAASDLKKVLVAHSNAENQVAVLGKWTFLLTFFNVWFMTQHVLEDIVFDMAALFF